MEAVLLVWATLLFVVLLAFVAAVVTEMGAPQRVWSNFVNWLTLEFLLTERKWENGGALILARSLFAAAVLYTLLLLVKVPLDWVSCNKSLGKVILATIADTIPWFGAIFAAIYAGFYGRFASQWSYLATLYNQILGAEVVVATSSAQGPDVQAKLAEWKAAFIADAQTLHLASKVLFASVVNRWGGRDEVKRAWRDLGNNPDDLDLLVAQAKVSLRRAGLPSTPPGPPSSSTGALRR